MVGGASPRWYLFWNYITDSSSISCLSLQPATDRDARKQWHRAESGMNRRRRFWVGSGGLSEQGRDGWILTKPVYARILPLFPLFSLLSLILRQQNGWHRSKKAPAGIIGLPPSKGAIFPLSFCDFYDSPPTAIGCSLHYFDAGASSRAFS